MRWAPWSRRSECIATSSYTILQTSSIISKQLCTWQILYLFHIVYQQRREVQRHEFKPNENLHPLILHYTSFYPYLNRHDLDWKLKLIPVEICSLWLSLTSKWLLVGCGEWLCEYTELFQLTVLSNSSSSGGSEWRTDGLPPPNLLLGQDQCLANRLKRKYSIPHKDLQ